MSWRLNEVSLDQRTLTVAHEANLCGGRVGRPVVDENSRTVTITLPRIAGERDDDQACALESRTETMRIRLASPLDSRTLQQPDDEGGLRVVEVPRWRGGDGTSTTACIDSSGTVRCAAPLAYEWCRTERPPVQSSELSLACARLARRFGTAAPAPARPKRIRPNTQRAPVDLSALLDRRLAAAVPVGWKLRVDAAGPSTSKRLKLGYIYGFNLGTPLRERTSQRSLDRACATIYREAARLLQARGQLAELHCRLDRLSLLGR